MKNFLIRNSGYLITGVLAILILIFFFNAENLTRDESGRSDKKGITFLSLAWQVDAIETVRELVGEWNRAHPEEQVELIQGTWNSVHDYLITGFETGDIPDVFHYESAIIVDFAMRGYLADLSPYIDDSTRDDILDAAWASVSRSSGETVGIPFIVESFIVLYNRRHFEEAGIHIPDAEHPWTWQEMREAAKNLTADTDGDGLTDRWGAAMGLRSAANLIMNHSIAFGGSYFYRDSSDAVTAAVGSGERELLEHILGMLYADSTMSEACVGMSSSGLIPGFLAGRHSMIIGAGSWARQQIIENADPDFAWGVLPPLIAKSQRSGINTQTFSIPVSSKKKETAAEFINFMTNSENMAGLAYNDWMLPARKSSMRDPRFHTVDDGWEAVSRSAGTLSTGPWVGMPGYIEWKSRVANPVFQELFSGRMTLEKASARIEKESNTVLRRYRIRDLKW